MSNILPHFNLPLLSPKAIQLMNENVQFIARPIRYEDWQIPMRLSPTGHIDLGILQDDLRIPRASWKRLEGELEKYTKKLTLAFKQAFNVDLFNGHDEGVDMLHQWSAKSVLRDRPSLSVPMHHDYSEGVGVVLIRPMANAHGKLNQTAETLSLVPKAKGIIGKHLHKLGTPPEGLIEVPYQQGYTLGILEKDANHRVQTLHGVRSAQPPTTEGLEGRRPLTGWGGPNHAYYDLFDLKEDPKRVTRSILTSFINSTI